MQVTHTLTRKGKTRRWSCWHIGRLVGTPHPHWDGKHYLTFTEAWTAMQLLAEPFLEHDRVRRAAGITGPLRALVTLLACCAALLPFASARAQDTAYAPRCVALATAPFVKLWVDRAWIFTATGLLPVARFVNGGNTVGQTMPTAAWLDTFPVLTMPGSQARLLSKTALKKGECLAWESWDTLAATVRQDLASKQRAIATTWQRLAVTDVGTRALRALPIRARKGVLVP